MESVEAFRARLEAWVPANLPRQEPGVDHMAKRRSMSDEEEVAEVQRHRDLQRTLWDGGFAGVCFPAEYGGLGLPYEYQLAFNEVVVGYETPALLQVPTFVPCGAVLLDFANDDILKRHIPAMLRGDEIWMQFLSEPSGGSDVAGALTTAVRDGDEWVLNGSKIWTSGAWAADYGLCLARTNWDVPKHRGLTVFVVPMHSDGVELHRIEMTDGSREFCQEFLTDVRIPDSYRVGEVDDGWTVGTRWMFHERNAMGGGSPYTSGNRYSEVVVENEGDKYVRIARAAGKLDDPRARNLIGESRALHLASNALTARVSEGMLAGKLPDTYASITRLMHAVDAVRSSTIAFELAGPLAVASEPGVGFDAGQTWLVRQQGAIGGGTIEMARNNISERVLGMPREYNPFSNVPFRDVPKGPPSA